MAVGERHCRLSRTRSFIGKWLYYLMANLSTSEAPEIMDLSVNYDRLPPPCGISRLRPVFLIARSLFRSYTEWQFGDKQDILLSLLVASVELVVMMNSPE